jgi:hypothetical protein
MMSASRLCAVENDELSSAEALACRGPDANSMCLRNTSLADYLLRWESNTCGLYIGRHVPAPACPSKLVVIEKVA